MTPSNHQEFGHGQPAVNRWVAGSSPARNRAEYLAERRSDQEGYVTREAIEACVDVGIRERPPMQGIRCNAFCDLSGGGADSMTLAVSHFCRPLRRSLVAFLTNG
jgi:hypothetical protein